jgi:hypothetical protein
VTDKVQRTFNAWVHLSDMEKTEFDAEVRKYNSSNDQKGLRNLSEGYIVRVQTGPLGGTCPYCGR